MTLGQPLEIRKKLLNRWEKGILIEELYLGQISFPYRLPLKMPSSSDMSSRFEEVRQWVFALEKESGSALWLLERKDINHRQLGRNSIPSAILFPDIESLLTFLGKKREYQSYRMSIEKVIGSFPELELWCLKKPQQLLSVKDDLNRILSILLWIRDNPKPRIYLRQLSLDGVDTKFIENHRGLLSVLLDLILDEGSIETEYKGVGNFEKRYGFLSRPEMVRFRFLSGEQREGYSDLTVRAEEFCQTALPVKKIFVVENDISALAFPPCSEALLIFGRGYHFGALAGASWMNEKDIYYWGDLDTHGFSILSQFRALFPGASSFLMDKETLVSHQVHWGVEPKQSTGGISGLSREENLLFEDLQNNRYGNQIRLEQEFIPYAWLQNALEHLDSAGLQRQPPERPGGVEQAG